MNGNEHYKSNYFLGVLAIIYFFGRVNDHGYDELISLGKFLFGALILSLFLSPDLDTDSSVSNRWMIFKYIWHPFKSAGHREILHNPVWGPFILIAFLWVPLKIYGIDFPIETIIGLGLSIEAHIFCDYVL